MSPDHLRLKIFHNNTCDGSEFLANLTDASKLCLKTNKRLCVPTYLYGKYCHGTKLNDCKDMLLASQSSNSLFGCTDADTGYIVFYYLD